MNVYPYVYKVVNRNTLEFYIGYREANKIPAEMDISVYKTSSAKVKPIFDQFDAYIIAEFITETAGDDAYWFEQQLISENINDPLCLNGYFIEPNGKNKKWKSKKGRITKDTTRKKISDAKLAIDPETGLTNAKKSSLASVETRLKNESYKNGTEKANKTKVARGSNKIGGQKSSITKNKIDPETGLTNAQLAGKKCSETKLAIDPETGSSNAQITGQKSSVTKNKIDPETGLSIAKIAGIKLKETLKKVDPETGLTMKQLQTLKSLKTKKENDSLNNDKNPNAKHIQIFNENDELVYDCKGTFVNLCKEKNLSYTLFIKSAKTKTRITYEKSPYFGWYAILR